MSTKEIQQVVMPARLEDLVHTKTDLGDGAAQFKRVFPKTIEMGMRLRDIRGVREYNSPISKDFEPFPFLSGGKYGQLYVIRDGQEQ